MEGATHFIEQYKTYSGNCVTLFPPLPINQKELCLSLTRAAGCKTIAIFLIKPKPTNEQ